MLVVTELILALLPALLVLYFSGRWSFAALTFIGCLAIFVLPVDLWLDNKWRSSAKL